VACADDAHWFDAELAQLDLERLEARDLRAQAVDAHLDRLGHHFLAAAELALADRHRRWRPGQKRADMDVQSPWAKLW
jgi:hypothetical protein